MVENREHTWYEIVHPLDDEPEEKLDPSKIERFRMTPVTKWSLFALRAYLILMLLLVAYRVADMAGAFGR